MAPLTRPFATKLPGYAVRYSLIRELPMIRSPSCSLPWLLWRSPPAVRSKRPAAASAPRRRLLLLLAPAAAHAEAAKPGWKPLHPPLLGCRSSPKPQWLQHRCPHIGLFHSRQKPLVIGSAQHYKSQGLPPRFFAPISVPSTPRLSLPGLPSPQPQTRSPQDSAAIVLTTEADRKAASILRKPSRAVAPLRQTRLARCWSPIAPHEDAGSAPCCRYPASLPFRT